MSTPLSWSLCFAILAAIAFSSASCGTTSLAKQDQGVMQSGTKDPADKGEQDPDYWTPERMRDAVPLPLPADDETQPRDKKPSKETGDQAESGPAHQPANEPETTQD